MRVGEAIALDDADVDLAAGVLHSPAHQVRQVPPGAAASDDQRRADPYLRRRDRPSARPASPSFFVSSTGTRVLHQNFHHAFLRLIARGRHRGPAGAPRRASTTCATPSRSTRSATGTAPASTSRPGCRGCRPTSGHVSPSPTYWYLHRHSGAARLGRTRGWSGPGRQSRDGAGAAAARPSSPSGFSSSGEPVHTPSPPTATPSACCFASPRNASAASRPISLLTDIDAPFIGAFLDHLETGAEKQRQRRAMPGSPRSAPSSASSPRASPPTALSSSASSRSRRSASIATRHLPDPRRDRRAARRARPGDPAGPPRPRPARPRGPDRAAGVASSPPFASRTSPSASAPTSAASAKAARSAARR